MTWKPPVTAPEAFEHFARSLEKQGRAELAALARRCAHDPAALDLVPAEPTWDVPHRLVAAARWLVLAGEAVDFETAADPWATFRSTLVEHAEFVARFVREQPVQTHFVQRSWALLPLFLTVVRATRRPLDLVELGPSGGLNLLWDRYRYRYAAGAWGDRSSPLVLEGEERAPVPAELLDVAVEVRRRRGIDLNPIDVTREDSLRLLLAFVNRPAYRRHLELGAEVLRSEPPGLLRGDYLDVLPGLLAGRSDDTLTVVFQTLSTVYLSDAERARLRATVDAAGEAGPLAWISTPTPEEHGQYGRDYPLELALWPGGERRLVARMDVHGRWLEWLGRPVGGGGEEASMKRATGER